VPVWLAEDKEEASTEQRKKNKLPICDCRMPIQNRKSKIGNRK